MLITDYSDQNFDKPKQSSSNQITEVITAGMIFALPIIFLIVVSAR